MMPSRPISKTREREEMTINPNDVPITEAIVLGVVQGLSEFLPISSTAHLRVVPALLGWHDPGVAYSAVIQLGSVIAVLAYFFKDLFSLATGSVTALVKKDFSSPALRMMCSIIVGTIPICVIGLLLKKVLEVDNSPLRSFYVIGGASLLMGTLLLVAEKVAKHTRTIDQTGVRDGLIVGLGQAMALIPGCSRSGSTLTVALFMNLKRDDAARFSFLLGVPAIILSGLLELKDVLETGLPEEGMKSLLVGLVVSAVVSYAAIFWLIKFLRTNSTMPFVIYRFIFGIAIIALSAANMIH